MPGHPLGRCVRALFAGAAPGEAIAGIGSVLLVPGLLSKPLRERTDAELAGLGALIGRLDLRSVDQATAELAAAIGAYSLKAVDAVHLATAVGAVADRFLTNNRLDFPQTITEIDIAYPGDLPEPAKAPRP